MTFAVHTGKIQSQPCAICGKKVQHREVRIGMPRRFFWEAVPHSAPCGMACFGGSVGTAELEARTIHAYPRYPCPACGFVASVVVRSIEKPDGSEKVEIEQSVFDSRYTIHRYHCKEDVWHPGDAYPGFGYQRVAEVLALATRYIPWLKDVLQHE